MSILSSNTTLIELLSSTSFLSAELHALAPVTLEAAGAADGGYIPRNLLGLHPRVTPSSEKEHQSTPNSSSDMEVEEEHSGSEKADFQTDAALARNNECEDADNVKMSSP